jgi:hypothetical protein
MFMPHPEPMTTESYCFIFVFHAAAFGLAFGFYRIAGIEPGIKPAFERVHVLEAVF